MRSRLTSCTPLHRMLAACGMLLCVGPGPLRAQDVEDDVVIGRTITIRSGILNEDRRIHVQLPDGYDADPDARYPVLYVLDGHAPGAFVYVAGLAGFLSSGYQLPPMIVVGIPNTDRGRDLTPPAEEPDWFRHVLIDGDSVLLPRESAGGADAFLRFLTEELAPAIERRYRTAPFRTIVGHSLGGLFVTHALLTRPASFNAYVASSPSLTWNDRALTRAARRALAALPDRPRFFYMAVGDQEGPLLSPVGELASVLEVAAPPALRWWYRVTPGETHQSNPVPAYARGLATIFSDWAVREEYLYTGDLDGLEAQFARASDAYGLTIVPPADFVDVMAASQLMFGRPDRAIEILERNLDLHPGAVGTLDALASALEAAGRLQEALERREQAVRRATGIGHPQLDALTRRRDELREKLGIEPGRGEE